MTVPMNNGLAWVLLTAVIGLGTTSCGKLKSVLNRNADGGESTESQGLGLAFLNDFEGEIDVTTQGAMAGRGGAPLPFAFLVRSGKVRVNFPRDVSQGGQGFGDVGYAIYDPTLKKAFIVSDTKKQAMVIDLNNNEWLKRFSPGGSPLPGVPPQAAPPRDAANPPKVTKTGRKDKVAGYACEDWEIVDPKDPSKTGVVCVAQEGASWFSLPTTGIPTEHLWMAELLDGKHFPLRFVSRRSGGEEGRVEVTKLDKHALAPALFEVPAGYKVIDLAQMFQGPGGVPSSPLGAPKSRRPRR